MSPSIYFDARKRNDYKQIEDQSIIDDIETIRSNDKAAVCYGYRPPTIMINKLRANRKNSQLLIKEF